MTPVRPSDLQKLFLNLFVVFILLLIILYAAVLYPVVNSYETGNPVEAAHEPSNYLNGEDLHFPIQDTQPPGIHPCNLYKQKIKEMQEKRMAVARNISEEEKRGKQEMSCQNIVDSAASSFPEQETQQEETSSPVPGDVDASDPMSLDSSQDIASGDDLPGQAGMSSTNDNNDGKNGDTSSSENSETQQEEKGDHHESLVEPTQNSRIRMSSETSSTVPGDVGASDPMSLDTSHDTASDDALPGQAGMSSTNDNDGKNGVTSSSENLPKSSEDTPPTSAGPNPVGEDDQSSTLAKNQGRNGRLENQTSPEGSADQTRVSEDGQTATVGKNEGPNGKLENQTSPDSSADTTRVSEDGQTATLGKNEGPNGQSEYQMPTESPADPKLVSEDGQTASLAKNEASSLTEKTPVGDHPDAATDETHHNSTVAYSHDDEQESGVPDGAACKEASG